MNHLPKPTLVKSLPIEEIPNINSKWKCKLDDTIIIIFSMDSFGGIV